MAQKPSYEELKKEISRLKGVEVALRENEDLLRATLESTADGILVVDEKGQVTHTNSRFAQMWQIPNGLIKSRDDEKLLTYVLDQLVEPKAFLSKVRKLYKASEIDFDTLFFKDKRILERYSCPLIRDGAIAGRVWSFRDVTERRKVRDALQESEEKYRLLVENANDAIFIAQDDAVKFPNPKCEEMAGYSAEELAKMPFIDLIHPDDRDMVLDRHRRRLSGEALPETYDFRIINKAGEKLWVQLNTVVINWEERPATLNLLRDITQQKKLGAQLHQTRKMEAIGTLAGGIAHEFNNALTGVVGNIQLLEMSLPDNMTVKKHTEAMKVSSHRMVKLTSQLLAYARGGKYQAKTMSLTAFVEDTLPIIKPNIDPSIRLETELPVDVFSVKADPTQLQMVLSAVVSNSTEAIKGNGRIRITAGNKEIDAAFAKSHPELNSGLYVCLSVEDDGKGMDEETVNKIFDPFYTTKFMGRGLGMAAVHGIIRNHDGWITVDSEPDKGTVVRIYLPALKGRQEEAKEKRRKAAELITGTGTILVIEDEETVLNVIRDMLDKLGYRILEAKTGKHAIEMAKTFDGDIDLALLDIKLPDIWGDKVYPQIMEARPDLKVIVCSGYSIDGPAQTILDAGAQDFIQKPFTVKTLSVKLKKVLESE